MLKEGQIIETISGKLLQVLKVTEGAALVRPLEKERRTIKTRFGEIREFEKYTSAYTISKNSEVKIIKQ